jgi:hypothetical protein
MVYPTDSRAPTETETAASDAGEKHAHPDLDANYELDTAYVEPEQLHAAGEYDRPMIPPADASVADSMQVSSVWRPSRPTSSHGNVGSSSSGRSSSHMSTALVSALVLHLDRSRRADHR